MRSLSLSVWLFLAAAALSSAAPSAFAAQESVNSWKRGSICDRDAYKQFPDHTPDHAAKRERFVRDCQLRGKLPLREPMGTAEAPIATPAPAPAPQQR